MVQKKRAAIYARVSTQDQDCDRQLRDLREFAERAGYDVVAVHTEKASGAKNDRKERAAILKLAQARKINAILVTEMSRWGRSTIDLIETLQTLQAYGVSVIAQTGLTFDLSTPQGKLMAGVMASFAEFERDLTRERVKSGLEAARARGAKLGRQVGQNPSDKHADAVLKLAEEGYTYRRIAEKLDISKTTVTAIIKRKRA